MMMSKDNDLYFFTNKLISQVVKEQDEYTIQIIEDYITKTQANGEFISGQIIPEGKLRHILNLGLSLYAEQNHIKLNASGLFPETMYVEYLRRENEELRRRLNKLELSD